MMFCDTSIIIPASGDIIFSFGSKAGTSRYIDFILVGVRSSGGFFEILGVASGAPGNGSRHQ